MESFRRLQATLVGCTDVLIPPANSAATLDVPSKIAISTGFDGDSGRVLFLLIGGNTNRGRALNCLELEKDTDCNFPSKSRQRSTPKIGKDTAEEAGGDWQRRTASERAYDGRRHRAAPAYVAPPAPRWPGPLLRHPSTPFAAAACNTAGVTVSVCIYEETEDTRKGFSVLLNRFFRYTYIGSAG